MYVVSTDVGRKEESMENSRKCTSVGIRQRV